MEKEYQKTVTGTYYHKDTPKKVVEILESARLSRSRVRLFYGDTKDGRDWMEEHDVTGRIGRSMGPIKIPILLNNSRSIGGGGILDHCIVKLVVNGQMRYFHKDYRIPTIKLTGKVARNKNGNAIARFKTDQQAKRWRDFICGYRMSR